MKITAELSVLKVAYMKAKSEKDTVEMSRLKSKARVVKNSQENSIDKKLDLLGKKDILVLSNKDGDSFELSSDGKKHKQTIEKLDE